MNARNPFLLVLLCGLALQPASAAISTLLWTQAEIVDAPVPAISSGAGVSVLNWQDEWWVVYVKGGDVVIAQRTAGGWVAPTALSQGRPNVRNPHVASMGTSLWVTWQDERSGQPEVYVRRRVSGVWQPDQCLSCDAVASRYPVIDGLDNQAFVAWEDSTAGSFRVRGRRFWSGSWGAVREISTSPADGRDPSVTIVPITDNLIVTWADFRGGIPQIYTRTAFYGTQWQPETQWVVQSTSCRHPSIGSTAASGGGYPYDAPLVSYESIGIHGAMEVWYRGYWCNNSVILSPDDGIASGQSNTRAHVFGEGFCSSSEAYGEAPQALVTWTDRPTTAPRSHRLAGHMICRDGFETDILPSPGLSTSAIGSVRGDPRAGLLQVWIEDRGGSPTLLARAGSMVGCYDGTSRDRPPW